MFNKFYQFDSVLNRSKFLLFLFLFISLLFIHNHSSAVEVQEKTNALVIGKEIRIESKELNEERPIWVYLPEDYKASSEKEYPVLYLLDGAFHFHHITGAVQILAKREQIPHMIVIAIPYIDYEHRARDLSPSRNGEYPPVAAADNFLAFIKEELISYTEKNYRTMPYRILFGHSSAGLFSIYVLTKNPELFNTIISISPSLYWDDRMIFKKMETFLKENPDIKRTLFLSVGDLEDDRFRVPVNDFAEFLEKNRPKGLDLHYSFMKNETHYTIPHRAFYNALESFFKDWRNWP